MEQAREVKKSFCVLSAAYIVLGVVLLVWPDLSVTTFCRVFGVGMIIFGCAHLILYFAKSNKMQSVMQGNMIAGVVGIATGVYILLKMESVLDIIPFALGVVALLGAVVKLQDALDLRRLGSERWQIMLVFTAVLFVLGWVLIVDPFENMKLIVTLVGVSLLIDGVGNLLGIFWIGYVWKHGAKKKDKQAVYDITKATDVTDEISVPADADVVSDLPAKSGAADDGDNG